MGVFEHFPYTNFHDLNLDWLLEKVKELDSNLSTFVKLNTIKYANPIEWDITESYETNTIVIDKQTGNAYISTNPVPAGVTIDNTEYWTLIFNYQRDADKVRAGIAAYNNGNSTTATTTITKDTLFWYAGDLYRAASNIKIGDAITTGGNAEKITIETLLKNETMAREAADTAETTAREAADTAETTAREAADTEIKNSIISETQARENADTELDDKINAIKTKIVNIADYGAVGDGNTDDTEAIRSAITAANADGKNVQFEAGKTYKIAGGADIHVNCNIDFNNSKILVTESSTDGTVIFRVVCPDSTSMTVDQNFGNHEMTTNSQLFGMSFNVASPHSLGLRGGNGEEIFHNQLLMVGNNGYYTNCKYYYNLISGTYTLENIQPLNQSYIILENAVFDDSSEHPQTFIRVERNNVTIQNIVNLKKFLSDTSVSIIGINRCACTTIRNIVSPNMNTTSKSGYVIGMYATSNTDIENINCYDNTGEGWGIFGNDFVTNVSIRNSIVNRWDSHYEQFGYISLESCIIKRKIQYENGTMNMLISNCTFEGLSSRADVGGFPDGTITVRDCVITGDNFNQIYARPFNNFSDTNFTKLKIVFDNCTQTQETTALARIQQATSDTPTHLIDIEYHNMNIKRTNSGAFIIDEYGIFDKLGIYNCDIIAHGTCNTAGVRKVELINVKCNNALTTTKAISYKAIGCDIVYPQVYNGITDYVVMGTIIRSTAAGHSEYGTNVILNGNTIADASKLNLSTWNDKMI